MTVNGGISMNILSRLEQYPHFTDVEKDNASYVLEHPHEILDLSVDALAKKASSLFLQSIAS